MELSHRYDFLLVFDVQDGNPNGDPDAGNLPRVDPETGHGLVTDVCLKRKVRNHVLLSRPGQARYDVYVKEKAVLGRAHVEAFENLNIALGEEKRCTVPEEIKPLLEEFEYPDGVVLEEDENGAVLVLAGDADVKEIKATLKESTAPKKVKDLIAELLKGAKARKPTAAETEKGRKWMCDRYFDVRTFGAVMSLASAPNCGQVRGPVQLTFSRSVDPIVQLEHSITRMAVATEKEAEKQGGDNRTMGRKTTVPYGLYVCRGFVSPCLAKPVVEGDGKVSGGTGFDDSDLAVLWEALQDMFENDRSAARGLMTTRKLFVFEHDSLLGNAHAADLFGYIKIGKKQGIEVARSYEDYDVRVESKELPAGVTLKIPTLPKPGTQGPAKYELIEFKHPAQ